MLNKKQEVVLSGIGGQGLVSSGTIIGEAASKYEDKYVSMTMTYGVSARGGFSKSDIIINDNTLSYYKALEPNIILILAEKAYKEVKNLIQDDTLVVINSNEVEDYDINLGDVYAFPFSEIAFNLGSIKTLNIVALGFIVNKTGLISKDNLITTVKEKYPSHEELNMKALEKGFDLVN